MGEKTGTKLWLPFGTFTELRQKYGLTTADYATIDILASHTFRNISHATIADRVGVTSAAIRHSTRRLRDAGLVGLEMRRSSYRWDLSSLQEECRRAIARINIARTKSAGEGWEPCPSRKSPLRAHEDDGYFVCADTGSE